IQMSTSRTRILTPSLLFAVALSFLASNMVQPPTSSAQSPLPVLFSDASSTRAIAVDSVTRKREPFSAIAPVSFGGDNLTRVMLFAGNLRLAPGETFAAVTADAEDESHNIHLLTVEYVGAVPEQSWATAIIVKLPVDLGDVGDVLVRIFYRGVASNRVRLAIGHVGDGPPDDPGAVPPPGPEVSINPITAGTL